MFLTNLKNENDLKPSIGTFYIIYLVGTYERKIYLRLYEFANGISSLNKYGIERNLNIFLLDVLLPI